LIEEEEFAEGYDNGMLSADVGASRQGMKCASMFLTLRGFQIDSEQARTLNSTRTVMGNPL
jgi:hypothetical protein